MLTNSQTHTSYTSTCHLNDNRLRQHQNENENEKKKEMSKVQWKYKKKIDFSPPVFLLCIFEYRIHSVHL